MQKWAGFFFCVPVSFDVACNYVATNKSPLLTKMCILNTYLRGACMHENGYLLSLGDWTDKRFEEYLTFFPHISAMDGTTEQSLAIKHLISQTTSA